MNSKAMNLAQVRFQAALTSGTSTVPAAMGELLTQLSIDSQLDDVDAELIGHSTGEEFPFLHNMIASGTPPDVVASAKWESAVRWLLNELHNWDPSEANSLNKLRALLSSVTALDANLAGISSVATQVASSQLTVGLLHLIESTHAGPEFNDRQFPELTQQIESFTDNCNLARLWQMLPHMNFFPTPDFRTAVIFIYNADPAALAGVIERRNDVYFSLMICTVLDIQAIAFAPEVNNLVFKFVSVANFSQDRLNSTPQSLDSTLQVLLLQVANTSSADWAAWMQALFKFPGNNISLGNALAYILKQLSQEHWISFFEALSLDYSSGDAVPVANILIPFANSANIEEKRLMWAIAYRVWSDWDYGQHESCRSMFSPAACALDFPVSMHYASILSDECLVEEKSLLEAIETVEERWFNSATELVTARNRLRSRLRLVQHGISLANGSTQALPPSIEPDADLYARTRYHYLDFNTI